MHQQDLLAYWVVRAYDPLMDEFVDVYKSYGRREANSKVVAYLKQGVCAVMEYHQLPLI